jgi:hypothetical protein
MKKEPPPPKFPSTLHFRGVRMRDGFMTATSHIRSKDVDASLDAEFGKVPHFKYCPHPINAEDFKEI